MAETKQETIPPLPTSTDPEKEPLNVQSQGQSTAATTAVYGIFGKLKENFGKITQSRKPWSEMLDRSAFAKPENMGEAASRLKKNIAYFKINYFIFVLGILSLCIILYPSSLFVLSLLLAAWIYFIIIRQGPITIMGRQFGDREKFLIMCVVSFVVVFLVTRIGSLLFYALMVSMGLVGLHASFRVPDDLFLDDAEIQGGGFLSMFQQTNFPATIATAV